MRFANARARVASSSDGDEQQVLVLRDRAAEQPLARLGVARAGRCAAPSRTPAGRRAASRRRRPSPRAAGRTSAPTAARSARGSCRRSCAARRRRRGRRRTPRERSKSSSRRRRRTRRRAAPSRAASPPPSSMMRSTCRAKSFRRSFRRGIGRVGDHRRVVRGEDLRVGCGGRRRGEGKHCQRAEKWSDHDPPDAQRPPVQRGESPARPPTSAKRCRSDRSSGRSPLARIALQRRASTSGAEVRSRSAARSSGCSCERALGRDPLAVDLDLAARRRRRPSRAPRPSAGPRARRPRGRGPRSRSRSACGG